LNGNQVRLDKILSSSGRVRILTALSNASELHLTEIARRTDQSYTATERHLKDLEHAEIVEEHDYGRVRIFKLNLENPKTKKLKDFILDWDNVESQANPVNQQAS
jgi:DNA-binding transcriptional ArsR family regulator